MDFRKDLAVVGSLVLVLCLSLVILASCTSLKPPETLPWPPGYQPALQPVLPPGVSRQGYEAFNAPKTVRRAMAVPVAGIPVTLTFDASVGTFDGVNMYQSFNGQSFQLVATYGNTKVLQAFVPTNVPTLLQVRTFRNWPSPGVITTWTNDDGSLGSQTNTFAESEPASFIFVPTNCASIGLFALTNGLTIAGWGTAGVLLQIQSSPDLLNWSSNATVTGQGAAWTVPVSGSQQQAWFRTTSQ